MGRQNKAPLVRAERDAKAKDEKKDDKNEDEEEEEEEEEDVATKGRRVESRLLPLLLC